MTVSKKDIQVRRQEPLLEFCAEDRITTVTSEAEELMRDPLAIQVVVHLTLNVLALEDLTTDGHIKLPFTARVYKALVQGGHFNSKAGIVEGRIPSLYPLTK